MPRHKGPPEMAKNKRPPNSGSAGRHRAKIIPGLRLITVPPKDLELFKISKKPHENALSAVDFRNKLMGHFKLRQDGQTMDPEGYRRDAKGRFYVELNHIETGTISLYQITYLQAVEALEYYYENK